MLLTTEPCLYKLTHLNHLDTFLHRITIYGNPTNLTHHAKLHAYMLSVPEVEEGAGGGFEFIR